MNPDQMELFATDPRGYKVFCSERRWVELYEHHPELENFWAREKDVHTAITHPVGIFQSRKGNGFHVYYRSRGGKNTELKVVVKFDEKNSGEIYAMQPSAVGQRNKGEVMIWPTSRT